MAQSPLKLRLLPLFAGLFAFLALACFAFPMYVIRPFRYQGATELSIALFIKAIGPVIATACAVICAAFVVLTFTRTRSWVARTAAIFALLLAIAGAYLARVNVYELMFHHLDTPQFEAADRAHIDSDDMVIAIRVNGQSRAYPIREIAYHHVVNDTLGGVPVVATY